MTLSSSRQKNFSLRNRFKSSYKTAQNFSHHKDFAKVSDLFVIKWTAPRDFWLQVFSWISFPQAPESTIRVVSNFFENSWIYFQLEVHHRCHWHRWQMEKIFNQKSVTYFFGHLWVLELTYRYIFFFMFILRCQQSDIVPIICHHDGKFSNSSNNTSSTGGKICRWCCWYRWQICHWCSWHWGQICCWCRWYLWCTLTCEYLNEFLKKFEMTLMLHVFSGGWGMMIHELNLKQKNCDTVPLSKEYYTHM